MMPLRRDEMPFVGVRFPTRDRRQETGDRRQEAEDEIEVMEV